MSAQTIRIHELEHITATDTDGDGIPDIVKVEFSRIEWGAGGGPGGGSTALTSLVAGSVAFFTLIRLAAQRSEST